MRTKAIAIRIIRQLRHDKRTLALMFMAPLLLLTLMYLLLADPQTETRVAVISAPESYVMALEQYNVETIRCDQTEARRLLDLGETTASVTFENGKLYIQLDGSNASRSKQVLSCLEAARAGGANPRPDLISDIEYVYGYEDLSLFDNFGSALIGIMVFFLVFLVAGISFLQERTQGTLEKLLSTPVKRWEIVAGYTLGFGSITALQSVVVALYVIYVLGIMMIGSFALVLLITLFGAVSALTLGIMLSSLANSEFQMMQFIPIVIIPQIFLSGIIELSAFWQGVGKWTPVYYIADALDSVMIKGGGFGAIAPDLLALAGFSALFMIMNVNILKRHRKI